MTQVLDTYAGRGIAIGILGVDEDDEGLLTRFLQRRGFHRKQCETRDHADLGRMQAAVQGLRLRFYDESWTIDAAVADLAAFAAEHGTRAALGVDSLQTVRCDAEKGSTALREQVSLRALTLKVTAKRHGLIIIDTSEMGRAGYRSRDSKEQVNALALGKESGSIEFQTKVQLVLFSVPGQSDLVQMQIAKNKLGPIHPSDDPDAGIYMRLDRDGQQFTEVPEYKPAPDQRTSARDAKADQQKVEDAARLAVVIGQKPGQTANKTEDALIRATPGKLGDRRWRDARATLGPALIEVPGSGNSLKLFLDGAQVPEAVLKAVPGPQRQTVAMARPPVEAASPNAST
jgi:hypothetical protein